MKKNTPKKSSTSNVEHLTSKIAELTEALQRERADATNVRRRAEEEREKMASFYKTLILREFLPAIDSMDRALKHVPKELADNDYVKGVQGVAKEFDKTLDNFGIERIKTIGEKFDPHLHEAIGIEDAGGRTEVVCEELASGYKLGDDVIRHAMVKVKRS